MDKRPMQVSQLIDMTNADEIFIEIKIILKSIYPNFDFDKLDKAYEDTKALFYGRYPGYKESNTSYHDFGHTVDAMLAMIRIIHGYYVEMCETSSKFILDKSHVLLGLLSTLFHDAGYIQQISEKEGTGGQYTLNHIQRSINFMKKYVKENNYPELFEECCAEILECTGFTTKTNQIKFKSKSIELLGKMLGTADLIGQMCDRVYLEKLSFLYQEFVEGNVPGTTTEDALYKNTIGFFAMTKNRFDNELDGVNKYYRSHFRARWNIDENLYETSINNCKVYLQYIMDKYPDDFKSYLRREIVPVKFNK